MRHVNLRKGKNVYTTHCTVLKHSLAYCIYSMQLHAYFYVLNSSVSFAIYEYTLPHTLNRPTQPSPSNPPSFVVAVVERSLSLSCPTQWCTKPINNREMYYYTWRRTKVSGPCFLEKWKSEKLPQWALHFYKYSHGAWVTCFQWFWNSIIGQAWLGSGRLQISLFKKWPRLIWW